MKVFYLVLGALAGVAGAFVCGWSALLYALTREDGDDW